MGGNDFGAPVALSGGTATSSDLSTLPVGYHDVVAVYLGTADHSGSESQPYTFRVRNPLLNTSTTSSVSTGSSVFGQQVTLTADVTSSGNDATGSVTFTSGATVLATTGIDAAGHAEIARRPTSPSVHTRWWPRTPVTMSTPAASPPRRT